MALNLVVIHAPHSGFNKTDRTACWKWISKTAREVFDQEVPPVYMMDTNGSVGSQTSEHIGNINPEKQDIGGSILHDFLVDHNLFLPATFIPDQNHSGKTWASTVGTTKRIDFIAFPMHWKQATTKAFMEQEVDLLNEAEDHKIIGAEVETYITPKAA